MHLSKIWRKKGVNHASVQWLSAEGNLEASSSFILFKELAGTSVPGLEKIKWSVRRDEDNGDLLQKIPCMYRYTQCPQSCRRPAQTHTSTGDSWTLTGKSGSLSCGVTTPFSWGLVHTRFYLCPPRIHFPVLYKFWQLYGEVNGHLLQEGLCHTQVCCTQSPWPCASPLLTHTSI